MTNGQTRVLVLLIVLAGMEMAVQPAIKPWLLQVGQMVNSGLAAGSKPKGA